MHICQGVREREEGREKSCFMCVPGGRKGEGERRDKDKSCGQLREQKFYNGLGNNNQTRLLQVLPQMAKGKF